MQEIINSFLKSLNVTILNNKDKDLLFEEDRLVGYFLKENNIPKIILQNEYALLNVFYLNEELMGNIKFKDNEECFFYNFDYDSNTHTINSIKSNGTMIKLDNKNLIISKENGVEIKYLENTGFNYNAALLQELTIGNKQL